VVEYKKMEGGLSRRKAKGETRKKRKKKDKRTSKNRESVPQKSRSGGGHPERRYKKPLPGGRPGCNRERKSHNGGGESTKKKSLKRQTNVPAGTNESVLKKKKVTQA